MKKGPVELGANEEEGKSESKVTHQIIGRLQHPKNGVRYLENIFFRLRKSPPKNHVLDENWQRN